ncbi:glycerol dehydrogenase [Yoonia sp. SS1-5]|uniref:Glycerol dehydrogenase n=1 Tax=Yoonia rhodophyticola TaxID=3137370 RepID=A0AAN0M613_9RHOB
MDRVLGMPAKYIQGQGALNRIGNAASELGQSALVFADKLVRGLVEQQVSDSFESAKVAHHWTDFGGECCRSEIDRLKSVAKDREVHIISAIGGGKALDAGKAVSSELELPFMSIPSIASTDGPVSSIAVEYDEDHTHIGVMRFNRSPSVVLVDTRVIAEAPARLLVAGMGDGLATWFEARACHAKGKTNFRGGAISNVAMTLARSCHETILEFGVEAFMAVKRKTVNEAVERVVEANVFLSGVGFENTGVAAAHALDAAVSRFSSDHSIQHGERVALGVLFQLRLEKAENDLAELRPFYEKVGLPTTLGGIGLNGMTQESLNALADLILRDGSPIRNLPFDVSKKDVVAALKSLI